MSAWRGTTVAGAVLALGWAVAIAAAAAGERVCGSVVAGGSPVRGAHVAAAERGLIALTDSTGAFCFDGVEPGALVLRVFALGFQPAERLASVAPGMAPVRFELQPLRGGSGTWSSGEAGGGAAAGSAPPAGAVPRAGPPAAGVSGATDPDRPGAALFAAVPMLVLPADSLWLAATHKGSKWERLMAVHADLARPAGQSPLEAKTWRSLGDRIRDLQLRECDQERPRKRPLGPDPCAYLARAAAVAELRAARLAGKEPNRDTRLYLQRLADGSDPRAAWAKDLLRGSAPEAQPAGTPPVPPSSPATGSAPGGPGEKR